MQWQLAVDAGDAGDAVDAVVDADVGAVVAELQWPSARVGVV